MIFLAAFLCFTFGFLVGCGSADTRCDMCKALKTNSEMKRLDGYSTAVIVCSECYSQMIDKNVKEVDASI